MLKANVPFSGAGVGIGGVTCGLLEPRMILMENGPDAGASHSQDGTLRALIKRRRNKPNKSLSSEKTGKKIEWK